MRRRCDVADWSKITNKFRRNSDVAAMSLIGQKIANEFKRNCNVAAKSQIGRKLRTNFHETTMSLRRRRLIQNYEYILKKLRRRCDVKDLSKID